MIIYKAENKVNGNVYIGKTVQSLDRRRLGHLQNAKDGSMAYFHCAIRKYGRENFTWSALVETSSESKLNALEKFYIMMYRKMGSVYNLTEGGEGATGCIKSEQTLEKQSKSMLGKNRRPCSEEKKAIISQKLKGRKVPKETLEKRIKSQTGRKNSEETKRKISESKKGHTFTEEARAKISKTLKNRPRSKEAIEKQKLTVSLKKSERMQTSL